MAPGNPHHVISRRIERRLIFREKRDLVARTKKRRIVADRSLLCYVAVTDLGTSAIDPARTFGMSRPAITYAVRRGRKVARQKGYTLERYDHALVLDNRINGFSIILKA